MDNLTHTLAGAALGEAGLKKRTALATPTLLIGANLPDVDVVSILFGYELSFRRGWTHGALAILILPLILTAAMLTWDRWLRRRSDGSRLPADGRQLLLLSYLAVFSHPLLDWLNTYGMRWLMPFDGRWFYGDALFIVDPWVWLVLMLGVILARRRSRISPGVTVLSVVTVYAALMVLSAWYGRRLIADGVARNGILADAVMVGPTPVNPVRRDVVIESAGIYYRGTLDWLPRPKLIVDEEIVPSNREHPLARAAAAHPEVARFLVWSRFPFFTFSERGDRYSVRVDDVRYGSADRASWAAVEVEVPLGPPRDIDPNFQTAFETAPPPIP